MAGVEDLAVADASLDGGVWVDELDGAAAKFAEPLDVGDFARAPSVLEEMDVAPPVATRALGGAACLDCVGGCPGCPLARLVATRNGETPIERLRASFAPSEVSTTPDEMPERLVEAPRTVREQLLDDTMDVVVAPAVALSPVAAREVRVSPAAVPSETEMIAQKPLEPPLQEKLPDHTVEKLPPTPKEELPLGKQSILETTLNAVQIEPPRKETQVSPVARQEENSPPVLEPPAPSVGTTQETHDSPSVQLPPPEAPVKAEPETLPLVEKQEMRHVSIAPERQLVDAEPQLTPESPTENVTTEQKISPPQASIQDTPEPSRSMQELAELLASQEKLPSVDDALSQETSKVAEAVPEITPAAVREEEFRPIVEVQHENAQPPPSPSLEENHVNYVANAEMSSLPEKRPASVVEKALAAELRSESRSGPTRLAVEMPLPVITVSEQDANLPPASKVNGLAKSPVSVHSPTEEPILQLTKPEDNMSRPLQPVVNPVEAPPIALPHEKIVISASISPVEPQDSMEMPPSLTREIEPVPETVDSVPREVLPESPLRQLPQENATIAEVPEPEHETIETTPEASIISDVEWVDTSVGTIEIETIKRRTTTVEQGDTESDNVVILEVVAELPRDGVIMSVDEEPEQLDNKELVVAVAAPIDEIESVAQPVSEGLLEMNDESIEQMAGEMTKVAMMPEWQGVDEQLDVMMENEAPIEVKQEKVEGVEEVVTADSVLDIKEVPVQQCGSAVNGEVTMEELNFECVDLEWPVDESEVVRVELAEAVLLEMVDVCGVTELDEGAVYVIPHDSEPMSAEDTSVEGERVAAKIDADDSAFDDELVTDLPKNNAPPTPTTSATPATLLLGAAVVWMAHRRQILTV